MRIIGCDLHSRQQTLAMLDTLTGEVVTRTLMHEGNAVREFYAEQFCRRGQKQSGPTCAGHVTRQRTRPPLAYSGRDFV